MNFVVVGGGGFIGSHLVEGLLNQHETVTVFDRPGAPYINFLAEKGAQVSLGTFLEPPDLEKAFSGADVVFHIASTTVPKTSNNDPIFDVESNLIGTLNLLNIAKFLGVKKIIFASSGGTVYGPTRITPIPESHPTDPISSYGITKLAIEKYIHLYWQLYGLDYCILRISNAYGERQSTSGLQGVIPTVIHRALHNEEIHIWGDGNTVRDYIYIKDIVSAFIKAAHMESNKPKLYNVGSTKGYSVNQIVENLESLLGRELTRVYDPGANYDVPINVLDCSLAKQYLDWEPVIDLKEGLEFTLKSMM